MGFVYKITNKANNKVYIGITTYKNPKCRLYKHISEHTSSPRYSKRPLYEAMQKYGISNFEFSVIEEVSNAQLGEREAYWIKYYNSYIGFKNSNGYNATLGGDGGHALISKHDTDQIISLYLSGASIQEIMQELHHSSITIRRCLKDNNINVRHKQNRKVIQLDKNLTIINIFNNMSEANLYFGKDKYASKINEACNGKRKTAYGYYWKYE